MRVAEVIGDFRNLITYMSGITAEPSAEEYNEPGYVVLRQAKTDAQALLSQPFQTLNASLTMSDDQKSELRR